MNRKTKNPDEYNENNINSLERRQFLKMAGLAAGSLLVLEELLACAALQLDKELEEQRVTLSPARKRKLKADLLRKLTEKVKETLKFDLESPAYYSPCKLIQLEDRWVIAPMLPERGEIPGAYPPPNWMPIDPPTDFINLHIASGRTGISFCDGDSCYGDVCDGDICDHDWCWEEFCDGKACDGDNCHPVVCTKPYTCDGNSCGALGAQVTDMIDRFAEENYRNLSQLLGTTFRTELVNSVRQMLFERLNNR